jgi:hypothetical protein
MLGALAYLQADFASTKVVCEQALQVNRNAGDEDGMAWSLGSLGSAATMLADYDGAEGSYRNHRSWTTRHGQLHRGTRPWTVGASDLSTRSLPTAANGRTVRSKSPMSMPTRRLLGVDHAGRLRCDRGHARCSRSHPRSGAAMGPGGRAVFDGRATVPLARLAIKAGNTERAAG